MRINSKNDDESLRDHRLQVIFLIDEQHQGRRREKKGEEGKKKGEESRRR